MRAQPLLLVLALGIMRSGAAAQFPAELAGRVVDQETAEPLAGAAIELRGAAVVMTDAAGRFAVRSSETGEVTVLVNRPGYAPLSTPVRLENGRTTIVVFPLERVAIELPPIEVRAERHLNDRFIGRDEIESSGARTLGELVRVVPGVVVRASGGGEQVSIRGSAPDAVLVLVDGAPLNDPVTGVADLSLIALDDVASVRVLAGAQSARFGARAEAGVIVVESQRDTRTGAMASLAAGSLDEREVELDGTLRLGTGGVEVGGGAFRRNGDFDYERPAVLGGGSAIQKNASERADRAHAGATLDTGLGSVHLRAEVLRSDRGHAGPMHAPTPTARQQVRRLGVTGGWRREVRDIALRLDGDVAWQAVRQEDPEPPIGAAYFDTTDVRDAGLRFEAQHAGDGGFGRMLAAGAELRMTRIESASLDPAVVRHATPGLHARAALEWLDVALRPELSVAGRVDRWSDDWIGSHDLTFRLGAGPLTASASHRSAFSPPSAADQFFRTGYGVTPNPDLEPERVRSEVELGISSALRLGPVPLDLGVVAYRGDIDGMIVWAPDFRFIWSPRNQDVKRDGAEAWVRSRLPRRLELSGWAALARVRYDWPGAADTAQVVYRPRVTGGASVAWRPVGWSLRLDALYTGVRQATPGGSNPLPSYWETDLALARDWHVGALLLTTALAVDRLFDNTDSFVHGYAEPGRTLRLEARLAAPASNHSLDTDR